MISQLLAMLVVAGAVGLSGCAMSIPFLHKPEPKPAVKVEKKVESVVEKAEDKAKSVLDKLEDEAKKVIKKIEED